MIYFRIKYYVRAAAASCRRVCTHNASVHIREDYVIRLTV